MKLAALFALSILSLPVFGQVDSLFNKSTKFVAIEKQGNLPLLFAQREGILFSFANKGDSLLENRSLGLAIRIPKGFRTDILESWMKSEISATRFNPNDFIIIKTIYFDFNSDLIRNDASAELDKMAALMLYYPFAQVEVVVHTDSRGSQAYNRKLAARRGASIKKYLETTGVQMDLFRITVSGEEQLIDCQDLADCDEIAHQLNRRAEFNFNPRTQ